MKAFKFITTLVIGVGTGLVAGYLTAPRSGKATRSKIVEDSQEYKDALEKAATQKLAEAKTILNETIKEKSVQGKKALDQLASKTLL